MVTELTSRTDLARIVEAAHRNKLPALVVPAQSVRAWEQREPASWAKVYDWLAAHSVDLVEVEALARFLTRQGHVSEGRVVSRVSAV